MKKMNETKLTLNNNEMSNVRGGEHREDSTDRAQDRCRSGRSGAHDRKERDCNTE